MTPHGCTDATTDAAQISRWWRQTPEANIGCRTGAGLLVVDVDSEDGETALARLEGLHGALPSTIEAITGKGRHIYLRYPAERDIRNSAGKLAAGVDIRAAGGFVVMPPSLHESGRRYSWSVDSSNAFATAPDWLLDMVTAPRAPISSAVEPAPWADFIRDGADKGTRNDRMTRFVGFLLTRFDPLTTEQMALAFNDARCRPPLSAAEVGVIIDSIAAAEIKKRTAL
jgi:hypothetical protein